MALLVDLCYIPRVHAGILLFLIMVLPACATLGVRAGGFHIVKPGDGMASIASRYHISVQELAEWNNLQDESAMKTGTRVYIPARRMDRSDKLFASEQIVGRSAAKRVPKVPRAERSGSKSVKVFHGQFAWPVEGTVHSLFGLRGGRRHDGLDIGGKLGDPVRAAAAGEVAFVGKLSGYGNIVILRHPDHYYTAYAHNSKHLVEKGERVRQGAVIAKVGATGRASGPHLHFEVRYGQQARNPLFFLNPRNGEERALVAKARSQGGGNAPVVAKAPVAAPKTRGDKQTATPKAAQSPPETTVAQRETTPIEPNATMTAAPTQEKWQKHVATGRPRERRVNKPFRARQQ
ncbi:MAG: peptidoglycan DD-metalloendopeptidase family protein [Deltaproteobacteria bacterium]|nr:peptidoglycan DD-metalloendopeptidase family protein [Deltaproteobacteria bacterium]